MAARIVRNDFVAGEIDPALFGRHDVEMFFHGASRVENFIPRKTGGLRKRAGTDLVWHIAGTAGETRDYRVVPYRYDKDNCGLLALYRKGIDGTQVYWRFWSSADPTHPTGEGTVKFLSVARTTSLYEMRHEQIGDTIFFTLHGHRAFKAVVTFASKSVAWQQLNNRIEVKAAPKLTAVPHDFHAVGDGYVAAERKYCLWGVKNGVRSEPSDATADITLTWISGAYIDVSFSPRWDRHDYYILGKLQGGQYGEVFRAYKDVSSGSLSDLQEFRNGDPTASYTTGGATWTLGAGGDSARAALLAATNPNARTDGIDDSGTALSHIGIRQKSSNIGPVLAVKIWFGAYGKNGSTSSPVQRETPVIVRLRGQRQDTSAEWKVVAEWTHTPIYTETEVLLSVERPWASGENDYRLEFADPDTGGLVAVPLRCIILCTDTDVKKYRDDNITPGTLVGEQTMLPVGSSGMDVDIITTWQQRLVAASTDQNPFTMWFSAIGDLYNFYVDSPQTADNAFEATIASTEANRILHIVSQKWLLAFTESGEHVIDATGGAFAFNTINIKKTSSVGAHPDIVPTTTESDVLFVAADGRSVYKMDYSLERDSVVPSSVSTRAQHITELHRIKKIAYQRYPDSVLWCLLDDGSLASMTFVPEENVCGWARHTLAGGAGLKAVDIFATGSIRADADTDTTSDLMIVLEDAATNGKKGDVWVERLRPCVVSDKPTIAHAECKDHSGYASGDRPAGGDPAATVAARLVTMRLEPQQQDMIGKQSNAFDTCLRIRRSGLVAVRPADSDLEWSGTATQSGAQPEEDGADVALVEKDVKIAPRAFQNRNSRLEIKSDDKWPCEILSLLAMMEFGNQKWGG